MSLSLVKIGLTSPAACLWLRLLLNELAYFRSTSNKNISDRNWGRPSSNRDPHPGETAAVRRRRRRRRRRRENFISADASGSRSSEQRPRLRRQRSLLHQHQGHRGEEGQALRLPLQLQRQVLRRLHQGPLFKRSRVVRHGSEQERRGGDRTVGRLRPRGRLLLRHRGVWK